MNNKADFIYYNIKLQSEFTDNHFTIQLYSMNYQIQLSCSPCEPPYIRHDSFENSHDS